MIEQEEKKNGTVLVVDDDEFVLNMVVYILKRANFHVLSAPNGTAAIKIASATQEPIQLLLADVDMPVLSGPALGEELKESRPDIHVMLMSGGQNGNLLVLNYGWAYIQKPFIPVKLVEMVTSVLHEPNRSQPGGDHFDTRLDTSDETGKEHK